MRDSERMPKTQKVLEATGQRDNTLIKHLTYTKTDSCCWTLGWSTGYEGEEGGGIILICEKNIILYLYILPKLERLY